MKKKKKQEEKQKFFYIISIGETESLPDYVFPDFKKLFDMMELLEITGEKDLKPGRIPIEGDFFVSRQPYLKRFKIRQRNSLKEFESLFSSSKRFSDKIDEEDLDDFERRIFRNLP